MFLENRTGVAAACRRLAIPIEGEREPRRVALVTTCEHFRLQNEELRRLDFEAPAFLDRVLTMPPLAGTSITVSGGIAPPAPGRLARLVSVEVGAERRELVARGKRVWTRQGNDLVPTAPLDWEALTMDWADAFGGTEEIRAGRDPSTGLPSPAHRASHPMNPGGKGFFLRRESAEGRDLPRLELLNDQIQRFGELPLPGCFAPTPEGTAVIRPTSRMIDRLGRGGEEDLAALADLGRHAAPSYLVFDDSRAGVVLRTTGMAHDMSLVIPPAGSILVARGRARGEQTGRRLRAAHLDTQSRVVSLIWCHTVIATRWGLPDLRIVSSQERPAVGGKDGW